MMSAPFPMVVSEVRSIGCVDLDPLDTELPDDLEHFGIYVDVYAGIMGEPGGYLFGVTVGTPSWQASRVANGEYLFPRHHLIVKRFHYETIRQALLKQFGGVMGHTWAEVAGRLARWGAWEFEDYRPLQE